MDSLFAQHWNHWNKWSGLTVRWWFARKNTEGNNWVILTWKVESLAELKFDPGFRVIGEHLSQIDSIFGVKFELTLNIKSIWLNFWVKMTPFFVSVKKFSRGWLVGEMAPICYANMKWGKYSSNKLWKKSFLQNFIHWKKFCHSDLLGRKKSAEGGPEVQISAFYWKKNHRLVQLFGWAEFKCLVHFKLCWC